MSMEFVPDDEVKESRIESLKNYVSNPFLVIELLACTIFLAITPLVLEIETFKRELPFQKTENGDVILDLNIDRPFVEESISNIALALIGPVLTAVIIIGVGSFSGPKGGIHAGICSFMFNLGLTLVVTELVKNYVGYLRPNFYNYCEFNIETMKCESDGTGLTDSRKSFPSGHSSVSFSSMTFLTLFFLGKIGVRRLETIRTNVSKLEYQKLVALSYLKKRVLMVLAASPISVAIFIAAGRAREDYHFPADIVAGSLIGIFCARFAYRMWYEDISSPLSGIPLQTLTEEIRSEDRSNINDLSPDSSV